MAVSVVQSEPTHIVVTHVQDIISYVELFILDANKLIIIKKSVQSVLDPAAKEIRADPVYSHQVQELYIQHTVKLSLMCF